MEKIQCSEMTVLIGQVRIGEDEEEDRSCDQEGFNGQRYYLGNKFSIKMSVSSSIA